MSIRTITHHTLESMMASGTACTVIDVREPKERSAFGYIPDSVNIEHSVLRRTAADLSFSKDSAVVVVCQSGGRSADAARILSEAGFTDVYDLSGGMLGWMIARKPLERPAP